jgi:transcriptional regulator with XRE-family HTH domain
LTNNRNAASDPSAEWLRKALKHANMTQVELARALLRAGFQFDRSTVNKMTKGERRIQYNEMVEISRITKYPILEPSRLFPPARQPSASSQLEMTLEEARRIVAQPKGRGRPNRWAKVERARAEAIIATASGGGETETDDPNMVPPSLTAENNPEDDLTETAGIHPKIDTNEQLGTLIQTLIDETLRLQKIAVSIAETYDKLRSPQNHEIDETRLREAARILASLFDPKRAR